MSAKEPDKTSTSAIETLKRASKELMKKIDENLKVRQKRFNITAKELSKITETDLKDFADKVKTKTSGLKSIGTTDEVLKYKTLELLNESIGQQISKIGSMIGTPIKSLTVIAKKIQDDAELALETNERATKLLGKSGHAKEDITKALQEFNKSIESITKIASSASIRVQEPAKVSPEKKDKPEIKATAGFAAELTKSLAAKSQPKTPAPQAVKQMSIKLPSRLTIPKEKETPIPVNPIPPTPRTPVAKAPAVSVAKAPAPKAQPTKPRHVEPVAPPPKIPVFTSLTKPTQPKLSEKFSEMHKKLGNIGGKPPAPKTEAPKPPSPKNKRT